MHLSQIKIKKLILPDFRTLVWWLLTFAGTGQQPRTNCMTADICRPTTSLTSSISQSSFSLLHKWSWWIWYDSSHRRSSSLFRSIPYPLITTLWLGSGCPGSGNPYMMDPTRTYTSHSAARRPATYPPTTATFLKLYWKRTFYTFKRRQRTRKREILPPYANWVCLFFNVSVCFVLFFLPIEWKSWAGSTFVQVNWSIGLNWNVYTFNSWSSRWSLTEFINSLALS